MIYLNKNIQSHIFPNNFRQTKDQSVCLYDLPPVMEKYNYTKANQQPGETFKVGKNSTWLKSEAKFKSAYFKAIDQCRKAFGQDFTPHVKDESPFEVNSYV